MLFQLIISLLHTQGLGGFFDNLFACDGCTGSSFTAIGAAMTTQGYWAQADIIQFMQFTSFKNLAILMYVCAAVGGLISMALGMPPKMYLWFFMGPALYHFLLATPTHSAGSAWKVANQEQNQSEVWKLAYPGIVSTRAFASGSFAVGSFTNPLSGEDIYLPPTGGEGGPEVSWAFAYIDALVSSVVQNLISWFGVYSAVPGTGGSARFDSGNGSWHLLSNLKWGMLDTITSAKATDAALRDVFVTFLSSECGDRFRTAVNLGSLAQANAARGRNLPGSVFYSADEVIRVTDNFSIPTPNTLGNLFRDGKRSVSATGAPGSYLRASQLAGISVFSSNPDVLGRFGAAQNVTCSQLLYAIMVGFRWEAGHTYARLMAQVPSIVPHSSGLVGSLLGSTTASRMTPGMVTNTLFYGWDLPNGLNSGPTGGVGGFNWGGLGSLGGFGGYSFGGSASDEAKQQFLINLITAHIVKNEIALAPSIAVVRGSDSEENKTFSDIYTRTVGAKSKFGELYVWALMVPYLQGVFLYFLAIAYPFVCVCMVVPGWHKVFFSWMSFWIWLKLWDVGFAIVQMAERSIWAMLGNSSDAALIFQRVAEMSGYGAVKVVCRAGNLLGSTGGAAADVPCTGKQIVDVIVAGKNGGGMMSLADSIRMLDLSMLLGASLDLDRANGYYIYLMSALYFAVPMVAGQLVLGSKAGVAGMVKDFIGGAASEGGRAAGSAFTAQKTAAATANAATQAQAASLKAMREQGMATRALRAGNLALQRGAEASFANAESQGVGQVSQILGQAQQYSRSGLEASFATGKLPFSQDSFIRDYMRSKSQNGGIGPNGNGAVTPGANNGINFGGTGASLSGAGGSGVGQSGSGTGGGQSPGGAVNGVHNPGAGNSRINAAGTSQAGRFASPGQFGAGGVGQPGGTGSVMGGGEASPGGTGFAAPGSTGNEIAGQVAGLLKGNGLQYFYALQNADGFQGYFNSPVRTLMEAQQTIGNSMLGMAYAGASAELVAQQGQLGADAFGYRAQADGINLQSDRVGAATQFAAAQSAWVEKANYANSVSGTLAAYGVQPGVVSAGQKPDDFKGASWLGQLGADAQAAAQFVAQDGAYFKWVTSATNSLQGRFGYDSLKSHYIENARGCMDVMNAALSQYATYNNAMSQLNPNDPQSQEQFNRIMNSGASYQVNVSNPVSSTGR